jgi:hypothetical protein
VARLLRAEGPSLLGCLMCATQVCLRPLLTSQQASCKGWTSRYAAMSSSLDTLCSHTCSQHSARHVCAGTMQAYCPWVCGPHLPLCVQGLHALGSSHVVRLS